MKMSLSTAKTSSHSPALSYYINIFVGKTYLDVSYFSSING